MAGLPRHRSDTDFREALAGVRFPVSREEIVRHARGQQLDDRIIEVLEHMPEDQYLNMDDVMRDVSGRH